MFSDPYRTVILSILGSILLLSFLLINKYFYPKKEISFFKLLILISLLPLLSLLRPGVYESGDFSIHIYRSMEFYQSLQEGHLMPSWAGNLNATYGYPLFKFNYVFPYYIISFFHFIGFSFVTSMKLFFAFCFIFSGISMYYLGKTLFKNDLSAFTSSIFYLFAPYHLISVHFKNTIGEIFVFVTIPLIFVFIEKFKQDKKLSYLLLSGLFLGITALGHMFIAMALIPVIFTYTLICLRKIIYSGIYSTCIILIAGLISLYQWGAILIYSNSLYTSLYPIDINNLYYPTLRDLLYSPWKLGFLFQGSYGEISNLLGYVQIFILVSIVYFLLKGRVSKKLQTNLIFLLFIVSITIFMVNRASIDIWSLFPFINAAGPHRLLILTTFSISLIAGYYVLIKNKNKKLIYILIFLCIGTTILNWGNRRVISSFNDKTLRDFIPYSTYRTERHFYANTKWVNPDYLWFSNPPKTKIEILEGNAKIIGIKRNSTEHTYIIDAKSPLTVRENTLYFPDWSLKSNGKNISIYPDKNGVISAKLPAGLQIVKLKYDDLLIFKIYKLISAVTLFSLILFVSYKFIRQRTTKSLIFKHH